MNNQVSYTGLGEPFGFDFNIYVTTMAHNYFLQNDAVGHHFMVFQEMYLHLIYYVSLICFRYILGI
jgi:hypothetical protein